jgi:predicted ATPase
VYRLPSLELPDRLPATIQQAQQYAALELFMHRATMLDPFFAFTDAGVRSMVEICAKLEGIPLAIELAAARVSTLGLEALRERLKSGLTLTGGERNLPARQQTMIAAIDWSYRLLSDPEKALLERVSVFVGGFTLTAAEKVCAGENISSGSVAELLSSLVNKSLVSIAHHDGRARYSMLDSVKTFAHDRLVATGQSDELSRRHATWFAEFAAWIDVTRVGKSEQWLRAETDPELENVRAALGWAFEERSRERALLAARIVGGLRTIWLTSGRAGECVQWAQAALAGIDEERDAQTAAPLMRALVQAVDLRVLLFDVATRALRVFERTGDRIATGLVHSRVAKAYKDRGRFDEAQAEIARASAIFADLPRSMPYAAFLEYRSQVHLACGHFDEALADIADGIAIVRSVGDVNAYRWQLFRAQVQFGMGQHAEGLSASEAILRELLLNEAVYRREICGAMLDIAEFRLRLADIEGGTAAAREALVRTRWQDFENIAATATHVAALAAAIRGQARIAAKLWYSLETSFDPDIGSFWRERDRLLVPNDHQQAVFQELENVRREGLDQPRDAVLTEALEALAPLSSPQERP